MRAYWTEKSKQLTTVSCVKIVFVTNLFKYKIFI